MKNQGQFVMSLRSKTAPEFRFNAVITVRPWLAARHAQASPPQPGVDTCFRACGRTASPASAASGMRQEQRDLEAKRKSQAGWSAATKSMPACPLRIVLRVHNQAVAHMNDAVADFRRLRIMRDHQHG